ncbi:TetR/AcrR family transcriptional regulator [Variovorax sp. J22P240]|uniref:TetR/AcrR family transcriptional regulator n=1 Tax=Variovorax sp. J22P240 TaxID=3053514 RepID=UPI002574CFDE|nr:TetR/AcrR family transcriptional regulator [Variovorax sp. J22P240]MDM0001427.1 TetR/AcrR family transcriptional regulator [Variovorax sp. J22P240]
MARGRSPGYDDQREMILDHAAQLFANRGYSATSMNQVAEACGFSKALLYHYYRDKYSLLVSIAENHVSRLEDLVADVEGQKLPPEAKLRELIRRFVEEYAGAKHAHRVLTEDVKFMEDADRQRVLGTQRTVVNGFARAVIELRPDLKRASLAKPLTMLLFGMINWMFIWMRPDGDLDYDAMAPVVADLFLGGLPAVKVPQRIVSVDI